MKTYKGFVTTDRLMGTSDHVKDAALRLDLNLDINIIKHWLEESIHFTVTGEDENIERFKRWFVTLGGDGE